MYALKFSQFSYNAVKFEKNGQNLCTTVLRTVLGGTITCYSD